MNARPTLLGDDIENPGNADAMRAAASMFAWDCAFPTRDELASGFAPLLALENVEGADSVYGFSPPPGPRLALVVGNERRGIGREVLALADRKLQIPLASRRLNTINVAAASAIALHYLSRGGGGKLRTRAEPNRHRPEVLFLAPGDAIELGSALRSAAAFGWGRVFVEDRASVWFGTDRVTRSVGRGAARRGRNAIHVIPAAPDGTHAFEEACVLTTRGEGEPIHRVDLARGPEQLLVLADESGVAVAGENLGRLAREVRVVSLDLPRVDFAYRLRLVASIALAEVARQVGMRPRPVRGRPRPPVYDDSLRVLAEESRGELAAVADLPR